MTDKIIKLLQSNLFSDAYIGLSLFDKLDRKQQFRLLKSCFTTPAASHNQFSWGLKVNLLGVPHEYESNYIKGKYYSYVIQDDLIMIDTPSIFKRYNNRKDGDFKVIENWENV